MCNNMVEWCNPMVMRMGFYYQFDNLRFNNSLDVKDVPIPSSRVVIWFK